MPRIKDPMVAFIERSADIKGIVHSYFPEWDGTNVVCPWHNDTKGSLHIREDGSYKCYGCGESGGDIVAFVAAFLELEYCEAKQMLYDEIVRAIPEPLVGALERCLWDRPAVLKYLKEGRGLPESIIREYRLGYEPKDKRVTIPVFDQFGSCVNLRRIAMPGLKTDSKVLNVKEHGEVRLYPEQKVLLERKLLLVEGEWDCLVGRSLGLPTCTWTGGASSWNEKYENFFRGKAVWVLYDNDVAGKEGEDRVLDMLCDVSHYSTAVVGTPTRGKDLSDWRDHKVFVPSLKKMIERFKFPKTKRAKKTCPHCGQELPK